MIRWLLWLWRRRGYHSVDGVLHYRGKKVTFVKLPPIIEFSDELLEEIDP